MFYHDGDISDTKERVQIITVDLGALKSVWKCHRGKTLF